MFLYFDKEGTLKTKIDHGEKLRQGGDMNVTVCLDTDFWSSKKRGDYSLELNALLMTLVFPDETKSISQTADSVSERVFEKLYDSEIVYDLVPGKTYLMYDFFFSAESATPYFGKLRINLTAGNSITTNDYVKFGEDFKWLSSDPILASGEAGIAKSCDSDGNCTYTSKIGQGNVKFTELDGSRVQTSELDPVLPPQEGSIYGNYWINTINNTVWLYNESLRTWTQVVTFGVNDKVEPVTIAFATTEAYVEKTIGFAKAQIDQQISIKYNDIMARFKDVYSKLGMALIKPDWNQQESGKQSYIFNKPNIKNTDVYHIDNLGEETGLFFVKNDSGRANPVYDDYILFQYAGKHQIVWQEVSVSFGRTKFGDTWSEWQKNNAEGSLTGDTAPTGELAGVLGQLYLKKDTKDLYYCAKDTEPYEWIPLSKVIKSISTIGSQVGYSEAKGITVQSNEKILYADNSESEAIQTTRDIPVKMSRGIKVKQSDVDPNVIEIYTDLEAKLNENIEKNPSKTYFLIEGNFEQPSTGAHLNPKGWIIDWGDGVVEESVSATPLKHDYDDGFSWHIVTMSNMRKLPSYIFNGERSTNKVKKAWIGNNIKDTGDHLSVISKSDDIEEVYFADGITSLVFCPLNNCPNLKKIKLPNTLTTIPDYFLGGNSKPLTNELKLLIPKSVTSFEGYYADNQPNLVTVMEGVEPPSASTVTFAIYKGSKIIVPKSAVNTYKTAPGWSTQAKKIVYEVDSSDIEIKYDKTGGRIEGDVIVVGDLTVNGEQHILHTENLAVKNAMIYSNSEASGPLIKKGGIGIKTNATDVYGVVYDPQSDSVKLGLGKADADGNFDFNANEGNPVAVRDDSNAFTNKHLVEWSDSGKKLVDSGFSAEEFVDTKTQQSIAGMKTFTDEVHFGITHFGKDLNIDNAAIKIFDNVNDLVTQLKADSIVIDNGSGASAIQYVLKLPKQNGTLMMNPFKFSSLTTSPEGDVWELNDATKNIELRYQDTNSHSVFSIEKDYIELSGVNGTGAAKVSLASNVVTLDSENKEGKHKLVRVTPDKFSVGNGTDTFLLEIDSESAKFNNRPQVKFNGNYIDAAILTDLANYVPIQSESADKYYSQITNEDGVISLRIFQNGSPDTQNLVIDKNGVTILGQKLVPGGGGGGGENKVDKLPASLRSQAYVRDKDGNDTGLAYTYTDEGNTLAVRNASGQVQVSSPSQDLDAANKKFVVDEIANSQDVITDTEIDALFA